MKPTKVVVGKVGLDGHDRGAKIIAATLRDAGCEVIYTGIRQTPETVVNIALQEDADILAISILSGAHNKLCKKVRDLLEMKNASDMICIVGGIISENDREYLQSIGYSKVYTPGTSLELMVSDVNELLQLKTAQYNL